MSLSKESPFHHKVVYTVHDGCSLRQKSIHHERGNTMLFSSISVINGQLFLRCSLMWRQICWIDYRTRFEELMSENPFAMRKQTLICLEYLLVSSTPSPIKCLVTKLRMNRNVYQVLLYVNSIEKWENEKYWIKNARGRSDLYLSPMFILLQS